MRCSNILNMLLLLLFFFPAAATAETEPWAAVLLSSDELIYEEALATFQTSMNMEVRTYNLHGDVKNAATLKPKIFAQPPRFIFALGAKAAYTAKVWTRKHQEIPVLFAMVLNWQKYKLLEGQSNIAGISYEVNAGNQFLNLSMFVPDAQKIGVIYSQKHSSELIAEARKAISMLGLELIEQPIDSAKDFKRAYRRLTKDVDAFWVLKDPITFTLANMTWLEKRCIRDKLVCIGQSEKLTEIGLMLSVRADLASVGNQAAFMAKNILERGQSPAEIGVIAPLGTHISLNRDTASRLGIHFSAQILGLATEIIE